MIRSLLLFILAAMPLSSHAIEEPDYEVVRKLDTVELRQYAPYEVAEVVLQSTAEDAGSQAFPILAGYIFGKNKGERKFAMAAPVTQTAAPLRMDMTAPVTQAAVAGGIRVQFVLPKGVTLDTAPEPLDLRMTECLLSTQSVRNPMFPTVVARSGRGESDLQCIPGQTAISIIFP